jgi:hypothetical protein
MARRFKVGASFQRAVACFAGTIVPGQADGGEERSDVFGVKEAADFLGLEGRTVIRLQDEWRAVLLEESGEEIRGSSGIGMPAGEPGELQARRDIADGEEMRILSFDGSGSVGEVDGPDGAWPMPEEDVDEELMVMEVDTAEAAEELGEFLASDFGEEPLEGGQSDGGAEGAEDADDVIAEQSRGAALRPAARLRLEAIAEPGELPIAEGAWREAEQLGSAPAWQAVGGGPAAEDEGGLADAVLDGAAGVLLPEAAAEGPGLGRMLGMPSGLEALHVSVLLALGRGRRHQG